MALLKRTNQHLLLALTQQWPLLSPDNQTSHGIHSGHTFSGSCYGVTCLGGTLAHGSHTEIYFSLDKPPLKKSNNHQVREESLSTPSKEGTKLGSRSWLLCPRVVTRTLKDGVTKARMLPEAFFAAERWKGSIPTPTGGGAALGTQLIISVPEAPADWDANSSRPTQLPVC